MNGYVEVHIVRFCARECELQMSGELSVYNMVDAWDYAERAHGADEPVTESLIKGLGYLIEPKVNKSTTYRICDVRVGSSIKPPWGEVPALMAEFMANQPANPEEWFYRFEEIHPFRDGNGRTGVLLYNYIRGTLDDPVWAPNFWHDERRTSGWGAP